MANVNQTASDNAEEFGFQAGDLVQEWLWDDDVDDSIRAKIEELTGEELVDEDYDSAVDGVIIWWRDGDPETGTSGRRKLKHGAVRGQDRRHECCDAADRKLRLERYPAARLRQRQIRLPLDTGGVRQTNERLPQVRHAP